MSLKTCIDNTLAAGEITKEEADQLKKRYDALAKRILSKGAVRDQLIAELEAEAAERKRRALLTETIRGQRENDILTHINAAGQNDPAEALVWILEHQGQARFQDVTSRRKALLGMAHAKMERMLYEFSGKAKISGDASRRINRGTAARLDNMVRELFGESTGDQKAAEFAQAWKEVSEDLRQQFNAAGGAIGKLENWGLPQHHNSLALSNATRQGWIEYIKPLLDREKMRHPIHGNTMTDNELQAALEDIWLSVTTDGWHKREPSGQMQGKGALFSQHADRRFLIFKDADSWLKYQKEFGDGDSFSTMMGHVSTMTRDIALMEVLGPNPLAMMTYLQQVVMHRAAMTRPNNIIRQEQIAEIRRLMSSLPKTLEEQQYELAKQANELDLAHRELRRLESAGRGETAAANVIRADIKSRARRMEKLANEMIDDIGKQQWRFPDQDPEPNAQLEARKRATERIDSLLSELRQELPDDLENPIKRAGEWIETSNGMFDALRGNMLSKRNKLAAVGQTSRNILTSAVLGSAVVSALSDVSFQAATRKMAGMPIKRVVSEYVRRLAPGGQQAAVRAGLIMDSAMHVMDQQARYAASINFAGKSGYVADRVLALSGLSPFTQAGKHAFGMDFQAHVADTIDLNFSDLTPEWRGFLERSGFTAADWTQLQSVPVYNDNGARFLRPQDIEQSNRELAIKYLSAVHRFTIMAVPEPTVRARSAMMGGNKGGTPYGELLRLVYQFKGFSVGIMFLHGMSVYRQILAGRQGTAALQAVGLLVPMTILGAAAMQIKELINGKDPRNMNPMESPSFWGAAFMQGGGLGIYGDFLFSDVNRFGGGLPDTVAGPVIGGLADPFRNLTIGNMSEFLQGEDTNIGREAVRFARRNTPGSNIWYMRLAWERMLFDELDKLADPKARQRFRRQMRKRKKDYGQDYWWEPGDFTPDRAPDLGAAVP